MSPGLLRQVSHGGALRDLWASTIARIHSAVARKSATAQCSVARGAPRQRNGIPGRSPVAVAVLAAGLALSRSVLAGETWEDPVAACDRAAQRAEAEWHLPAGLLSAIGVVESGRGGLGQVVPVVWPWTINAGGQGRYLQGMAPAIAAVRALQASGMQMIDVGCFQVDLYYHPQAFASLAAAFDPDTNAQAAARILVQSRLSAGSWESAIALYHSASPLRGAAYLRHVQAVWPQARARGAASQEGAYVPLLSPAAREVRVIAPDATPGADLPRILATTAAGVVQWTVLAPADMPIVLDPPPRHRRGERSR